MKAPSKIPSQPVQLRHNKHEFSTTQDYLNADLARAVRRPPPKYPRMLAGGICVLVASVITWAALSKVDEVVTAPSEVIPSSRVQPVTAPSGGLLEDIKVEEGQSVKAGEPLVQLNPTLFEAEFQRLQQQVTLTENTVARLEAERIGNTQSGDSLQNQLLASRLQQFEARQQAAEAEANRQQSTIKSAQAELEGLKATLTVAEDKLSRFAELAEKGAVPHIDYLSTKNDVVSLQKQIAAQEQTVYQAEEAYTAAKATSVRLLADRKDEILTELEQQQKELESLKGQLSQAEEQLQRETIRASIDGTVYNLKVDESAGNIQAGEELLSILPEDASLILEAKLLSKDAGFIEKGMPVNIKLETFNYQEFGLLQGTVKSVSPNAIQEQGLGSVYLAHIEMEPTITINGEEVPLTPGMPATADIVIRQKTVLRSVLEPILEKWDQTFSLR